MSYRLAQSTAYQNVTLVLGCLKIFAVSVDIDRVVEYTPMGDYMSRERDTTTITVTASPDDLVGMQGLTGLFALSIQREGGAVDFSCRAKLAYRGMGCITLERVPFED